MLFQLREKVAVPAEQGPSPPAQGKAGAAGAGRHGVHGEEDPGQFVRGTPLPLGQPPQLLQGGGEPPAAEGQAGPGKLQPRRGDGKGNSVQDKMAVPGQTGSQLEADLPVCAVQLCVKHKNAPFLFRSQSKERGAASQKNGSTIKILEQGRFIF